MRRINKLVMAAVAVVGLVAAAPGAWLAAQEDCKDCALLSRMPGFRLDWCKNNFDAREFPMANEKTITQEGDVCEVFYGVEEGRQPPSELQIRRNYTNAVKSLGGTVLFEDQWHATMKLVKGGKEIWIHVQPMNHGENYQLTILEKGEMKQEVTANAIYEALSKDGFIALYINFDTDKWDLKPESQGQIGEIASMLKANAGLKISVEGHTDNTGNAAANKTLSERRAKSVVDALIAQGIAAGRLSAAGFGQERPVADNRTEEGRAKNRRVELVKK